MSTVATLGRKSSRGQATATPHLLPTSRPMPSTRLPATSTTRTFPLPLSTTSKREHGNHVKGALQLDACTMSLPRLASASTSDSFSLPSRVPHPLRTFEPLLESLLPPFSKPVWHVVCWQMTTSGINVSLKLESWLPVTSCPCCLSPSSANAIHPVLAHSGISTRLSYVMISVTLSTPAVSVSTPLMKMSLIMASISSTNCSHLATCRLGSGQTCLSFSRIGVPLSEILLLQSSGITIWKSRFSWGQSGYTLSIQTSERPLIKSSRQSLLALARPSFSMVLGALARHTSTTPSAIISMVRAKSFSVLDHPASLLFSSMAVARPIWPPKFHSKSM